MYMIVIYYIYSGILRPTDVSLWSLQSELFTLAHKYMYFLGKIIQIGFNSF